MVESFQTATIVIISGTVIFTLMSVTLVYFVLSNKKRLLHARIRENELIIRQQKELQLTYINAQEEEKQELARVIHDEVGGSISRIKYQLELLQTTVKENKLLDSSLQISSLVQNQIRQLASDLLPYKLAENTLHDVIKNHLQERNKYSAIKFYCEYKTNTEISKPSLLAKTIIYRIILELCTNALKHSKAKSVLFSLIQDGELLNIKYEDDGIGMSDKIGFGTGLNNIKSYCRFLDGEFTINMRPDGAQIIFSNLNLHISN